MGCLQRAEVHRCRKLRRLGRRRLIPQLPKYLIALEWNYEAGYDFLGKTKPYAEAGIPFYVCPSTSVMRTIVGRTDN